MPKTTAIIVDDERLARQRLIELLTPYSSSIEVIAEASNGEEAVKKVNTQKPNILFLDIKMPLLNGFEVLKRLEYQPQIVFITAYEEFAVQAFEHNSIDYLLKPFRADRLKLTMERLISNSETSTSSNHLDKLLLDLRKKPIAHSISVQVGNKLMLVKLTQITHFTAEDKYTFIHTLDDKKYIENRSLKSLLTVLPPQFMQIHRSLILNFELINNIKKGTKSRFHFELKNAGKTVIQSGTTFAKEIREKLGMK